MQVEAHITISATPQTIFAIYADVANWHKWDPDTKAASINGPFVTGSTGSITPPKGLTVPMEFVSVIPDRLFTVVSRIPLFSMRFEHVLTDMGTQTEALHRVTFSGQLAFLLGRIIGGQLRTGLPVTLAQLKQKAEQVQARNTTG